MTPHPLVILVQLLAFGIFVHELVAFVRLNAGYATRGKQTDPLPAEFPSVGDLTALTGLEGATKHARYRWDSERQALLFRRVIGRIPGNRGSVVGAVFFDGVPIVRWRGVPSRLPGLVAVLLILGAVGFIVFEGEPMGVVVGLAGLVIVPATAWLIRHNGRRCLHFILPEIGDALREHLGE